MNNFEPALSQALILSDLVITEVGTNKSSLIGCFTCLNAPKFPFATPLFYVTALVTNIRGKVEQLVVTLRIEDERSGHVSASVSANVGLPPDAPAFVPAQIFQVSLPVPPFQVQTAGEYSVLILVNNMQAGKRSLEIRPLTQQAPPS